jgi:exodeoxyribonuclease-3
VEPNSKALCHRQAGRGDFESRQCNEKIATSNINNINRRLPNLLAWLAAAKPDAVCLQELKAEDRAFPEAALLDAGYNAVWQGQKTWNGVAILARGKEPVVTCRRLPGDQDDQQSRYIEAAVKGVLIGCIYLPNGNPQPGPSFDYKLAWFERLISHATGLFDTDAPVILGGRLQRRPTDFDICPPKSWDKDVLVQPGPRACYRGLVEQGWTDAVRTMHPDKPMYTFWHYLRNRWPRDASLRLDHMLLKVLSQSRFSVAIDESYPIDFMILNRCNMRCRWNFATEPIRLPSYAVRPAIGLGLFTTL